MAIYASVAIPTFQRSAFVLGTSQSVLAQKTDFPYEILVLDNACDPVLQREVEQVANQADVPVRYIPVPNIGLHNCRHAAVKESSGDLLIYLDDDVEAFPTWLRAIGQSFQDKEVVLVGGKCLPKFETEPPDWVSAMWQPNEKGERSLGFLSLIDLGDESKPVNPLYVFGCNYAVRRSVLIEACGFHPDALPQELIRFRGDGESHVSLTIQAKGYKAMYNPQAAVYHRVPKSRMTIEYFCRRAYNQGISDSYIAIRRAHGLDSWPSTTGNAEPPPGRYVDLYRRIRRKPVSEIPGAVWKRIRRKAARLQQALLPTESDVEDDPLAALRRKKTAAYRAGYAYHQAEVRRSPELLAWVLQPDYWDYCLPAPDIPCIQKRQRKM